jgi:predicted dehydrogenase
MNAGPLPADSWILGPEGGGRIIGEACHIFDLFNYLIGSTPVDVVALPVHATTPHISKTDNFSASIRYSDGSLCTLNYTSLGSAEFPKEGMEIFFEGKTIVLDDYRQLHFYGMRKKPVTKSQQDKGHLEELRQFANYLQGNGPLPMTLAEIESATRTSFAVDELVRHGAAT